MKFSISDNAVTCAVKNKPFTLGLILLVTTIVVGIVLAAPQSPVAKPLCADESTKQHIRELMLRGLDTAFQDRITSLFEVWMRSGGDQPAHPTRRGIEQGVDGYVYGRGRILAWTIPVCS